MGCVFTYFKSQVTLKNKPHPIIINRENFNLYEPVTPTPLDSNQYQPVTPTQFDGNQYQPVTPTPFDNNLKSERTNINDFV